MTGRQASRPMRVLHLPVDRASQLALQVDGLRKHGVQASGLLARDNHMSRNSPFVRSYWPRHEAGSPLARTFRLQRYRQAVMWAIARSDVVHWHSRPVFADMWDMRLAQALGKVRIIQFHGTEARQVGLANPHLRAVHQDPGNDYFMNERAADDQVAVSRFVPTVLAVLDLIPHIVPGAFERVLPIPTIVDTADFRPAYPSVECDEPLVVHAASRSVRGSDVIRAGLDGLRPDHDFRVEIVQGIPRPELMELMIQCDIYVDQMALGVFGVAALEAMAMGKPVVSYLTEDFAGRIPPACPVVPSTPGQFGEVMRELLESPVRRHRIGEASRVYVEEHHDVMKVTADLKRLYEDLLADRPVPTGLLWPHGS